MPPLGASSAFVVWGPRQRGPRSLALARELGVEVVLFMTGWRRSGARWALPKYLVQAALTAGALLVRRPRIVFVQSPPSFAAWVVSAYCRLSGAVYVIDAHSAAFQVRVWRRPRWLHERVARGAVATLVTDEHWAETVRAQGSPVMVIPDAPTEFPRDPAYPPSARFRIAVVNTWAPDEPLVSILEAARGLPDVEFVVTGALSGATVDTAAAPPNVRFSGFLPEPTYHALLDASDAVMCLTTRDHTMQRGACEALSHARPIVTSDWPRLRSYFRKGAVFVDDSSASIRSGVERLRAGYDGYRREIAELRSEERAAFRGRREALVAAIAERLRVAA